MPIKFKPDYEITSETAKNLMRIEAAKEKVDLLPLTPTVLASLRETARLLTTHYSTMIEGNQLKSNEVIYCRFSYRDIIFFWKENNH